jgi:aminopeptidase N
MAVGLYDKQGEKIVLRKRVELDVAGTLTVVPELSGEKIADLVMLNDGDLSYGKVLFDDRSLATLTSSLGLISDPLARVLAWSGIWEMTRDAHMSASEYVTTVFNALPHEDDVAVIASQLLQIGTAVELYAADSHRDALRTTSATALQALMENAEPGSDLQLQYARSFASFANTPAQIARVRELLDGALNGLVIDVENKWHFLNSLIERGAASIAEVETQLASDKTADGERAAAFGRAAIGNAATKKSAWELITTQDLSNHIQLQTAVGFNRPRHRHLTAEYVDNYFDTVADYWNAHTYEFGKSYATQLFPNYQVSQDIVAKAESWLSGKGADAPAALQRIVAEQRDALARAVKAQAIDA